MDFMASCLLTWLHCDGHRLWNWAAYTTVLFWGLVSGAFTFMADESKLLYLSKPCVQFLLFSKTNKACLCCLGAPASADVWDLVLFLSFWFAASDLPGLGSLIIKCVRTLSSLMVTMLGMWVESHFSLWSRWGDADWLRKRLLGLPSVPWLPS